MASSEKITETGVGAKSTFGGTDFDWQNYERYRPQYPPALYEAIFDFHSSGTSPSWGTAYDFGCGPGTTFASLLRRFSRVVGVDLNRPQLDAAIARFGDGAEKSRVSVKEGKAEEVAEVIGEGSVDLVLSAEAVHWFDAKRWLEAVGKILRPGGTIAIIEYSFDELDDEEANDIWQSYLRSTLTNRPAPPEEASKSDGRSEEKEGEEPSPPDNNTGIGLMTSLLDTLAIPSTSFTFETRVHWCTPYQHSSPFLPPGGVSSYHSMRSPDCRYTLYNDKPDAPLLRQERTTTSLRAGLETLGNLVKREEEYDGGQEMRAAIEAVGEVYKRKGRSVFEARWPCALVLARKK